MTGPSFDPHAPQGYGRTYAHPPIKPRKRRLWLWLVLSFLVIALFASCVAIVTDASGGARSASSSAPGATPAADGASLAPSAAATGVSLSVTGTGQATVTWKTRSGQNQKEVTLPWKIENVDVDYAVLTATRTNGTGKIVCSIKNNGKGVADTEAEGRYASCSANGWAA